MLLETVNLCRNFSRAARRKQTFPAVSNVCLSMTAGDFVTITGKSGSGKTTLLTLLAGLAAPSSGNVYFQGKNLHELSDHQLSGLRNREIGFVPQGGGLFPNLTLYDNVRAPQLFSCKGSGVSSERATFLLEAMDIADLAKEYPGSLSGGEMRRASIARALFNDPALLIADEPTGDLDPENTLGILELLENANKLGTALILVTHDEDVAVRGARRFTMSQGELSPAG